MRLFHATASRNLDAITAEGMRAGSYWSACERLLDYYVEAIRDEGDEPVVLAVDLEELDEAALSPDLPGVEEPITSALGMREAAIRAAWARSARGWRASLEILRSLRCDFPIPAALIRVVACDPSADGWEERPLAADGPRP